MALVSLKTEEGSPDSPSEYKPCPYGSGTSIWLDESQTEALGLTADMKAGTVVQITALAYVANATQSVEDDGDDAGPDVCLRIQLTEMEVRPSGKKSLAELAKGMYPSSEE